MEIDTAEDLKAAANLIQKVIASEAKQSPAS
jgi:hypothetical protein